jgi:hypothetical protein
LAKRGTEQLPDPQSSIAAITAAGVMKIETAPIRAAIEAAYRSRAAVDLLDISEKALRRLVSAKWSTEKLATFLSGWRSTHGTALFVSGLIIRLHREAMGTRSSSPLLMWKAAAEIGEIIAEDTGVDDTPHNELFARFANQIVGDDRWQLRKYSMPACESFRQFVKDTRLSGPIEDAILTTAASESWNSGEYSYFDPLARSWLKRFFSEPTGGVEDALAYVSHHSGDVELGHFLHAIDSWILYCKAKGIDPDPERARTAFEGYFDRLLAPFEELDGMLTNS